MITLSFLRLLQDSNLGAIDTDLFFQKLTLDKTGIYLADVGDPVARGSRDTQSYELLARGKNDADGYKRLTEIRRFIIRQSTNICTLPAHPPISSDVYENVELSKPSTITNVGLDANNRIIYSITGTIIFKEK